MVLIDRIDVIGVIVSEMSIIQNCDDILIFFKKKSKTTLTLNLCFKPAKLNLNCNAVNLFKRDMLDDFHHWGRISYQTSVMRKQSS